MPKDKIIIEEKERDIGKPEREQEVKIVTTVECVEVITTSLEELDKRITDLSGTLVNLDKQRADVIERRAVFQEQKDSILNKNGI